MNAAGNRLMPFTPALDEASRRAIVVSATVVFCTAIFALLFRDDAAGAWRVWFASPTFNHCFLILPITLFLIWYRRGALIGVSFAPSARGLLIVLASSLLWIAGTLANVLEVRQFAVVAMLQGTFVCTFGTALYRRLAAPFLYLFFLVPSGAWLIPALQAFTARFAVIGLQLLRVPVFSHGAVIETPAGAFAVAEACAGLRFLIAAVAFGVFFAVITYRSLFRRGIFVFLSVVVPIVANGLRVLGLIAAAEWLGNPAAALADHLVYGWIFFSLVLLVLILLGQLFSDQSAPASRGQSRAPLFTSRHGILAPLFAAGVAISCAGVATSVATGALDRNSPNTLPNSPPRVNLPWREVHATDDWKPLVPAGSRTFLQSFAYHGIRVDRFIAMSGRGNADLLRSNNRDADERVWSFEVAQQGELLVGKRKIPVRISHWRLGTEDRTIWSFYVVNGQVTSDILGTKWNQLMSYIGPQICPSAYAAFSTTNNGGAESKSAIEFLIAASEDLKHYACRLPQSADKPKKE